jgi:hypothetical protein
MQRLGRFTPRNDPVPILFEVGWAPELVWTGAGNTSSNEILSPDRPARRKSLYRLSHPEPHTAFITTQKQNWCR